MNSVIDFVVPTVLNFHVDWFDSFRTSVTYMYDWRQTDRQTDGQTDRHRCRLKPPPFHFGLIMNTDWM